jgi:hypothetical protein
MDNPIHYDPCEDVTSNQHRTKSFFFPERKNHHQSVPAKKYEQEEQSSFSVAIMFMGTPKFKFKVALESEFQVQSCFCEGISSSTLAFPREFKFKVALPRDFVTRHNGRQKTHQIL